MKLLRPTLTVNGEKNIGGVPILYLERQLLDLRSCPLKARIDDLVAAGQRELVLNLEHLPRADSSDIGKLIRANLAIRQCGGQIHVCEVHPEVQKLLEMTRLDTVFKISTTEKDAVRIILYRINPDIMGASDETLR